MFVGLLVCFIVYYFVTKAAGTDSFLAVGIETEDGLHLRLQLPASGAGSSGWLQLHPISVRDSRFTAAHSLASLSPVSSQKPDMLADLEREGAL